MIRISNEESAAVLARSYRRELQDMGSIPWLAETFHIPMQEIRIGFREFDEAHAGITPDTLNFELHGG